MKKLVAPCLFLAMISSLALAFTPGVQTNWVHTLTISGEANLGVWGGAVLNANLTAAPYCEPVVDTNPGDNRITCAASASVGVKGKICITNTGEDETKELSITHQVAFKNQNGTYTVLKGTEKKTISSSQIKPGDTVCWDYQVPFTPDGKAEFQANALVTITNYKDWLAGGANCPGPVVCPHGVDLSTVFSMSGLLIQTPSPTASPSGVPVNPPTNTPTPPPAPAAPISPPLDTPTALPTSVPQASPTAPPTIVPTSAPSSTPTLTSTPLPTSTP